MKIRAPLSLLFLLVNFHLAAAEVRNDSALWRPRLATPAIVALDTPEHRDISIEIKASPKAYGWQAVVTNDLKTWPCELVSAKFSTIHQGTEPGWQIKFRVPADTSPELFHLSVACNEFTSTQHQSVSVIRAFSDDFYVLHLADEQIVNEKHTDPSGQYFQMVGTAEEMVWMQEPINLIHPRFAFITGDQIDYNGALDGWNNWHNWGYEPGGHKVFSEKETLEIETRLAKMYIESHRGYRVPYVETPGNHDVTPEFKPLFKSKTIWHPISAKFYEENFGQRSWSFRMDDFYVLLHDWSGRKMHEWATADYTASLADPSIHYRLVGQHFVESKSFDSHAFIPDKADLMLVGHGHGVKTIQTDPYYIYMDGPAFRYGTTGFFNFRKTTDGWSCDQTQTSRDVKKDVWHLFNDNGIVKKVRADQPDAMNIAKNSVTITNDLPEEFYDGRVRFVLPKGKYRATQNGTILAQYDCVNDSKTAVLVKVVIPANGSVRVEVESTR